MFWTNRAGDTEATGTIEEYEDAIFALAHPNRAVVREAFC